MNGFKTIHYIRMLFETTRSWFAINSSGQLSILFRYLSSIIYPLQESFDDFDSYRQKARLIALCKWEKGQLENILNEIYPSETNDLITVENVEYETEYACEIPTGATTLDYTFYANEIENGVIAESPAPDYTTYLADIDDMFLNQNNVVFNIPSDIYLSSQNDIENTIKQINIGVNFTLSEI